MEKHIKLILTDDKVRYRNLVKEILEPFNVTIIGEAEDGLQCLDLLKTKKPDILLLDLEMPIMDGNLAFEKIRIEYPEMKVIILSFHYDQLLIENYIDRGAKGYLIKDGILDTPILLINALQKVNDGGTFIYEKPGEKRSFSTRQKQILPLIFEGKSNTEIGKDVGLSRRAVEKQRTKIYELTGVEKAIDFYKYAFARGLQYLGLKK